MQGQRSTMELDQGSSSSNPTIDPQVYWSNILSPLDTREITDCFLQPDDTSMAFTNGGTPENESLNGWDFNTPESSHNAANHAILEESKRDHEWASAMVSGSATSPRLQEGSFEARNMLSLDNMDTSINNDQITSGQEYNSTQNTTYGRETVNSNQLLSSCHLFNSRGPDSQRMKSGISSANACSSSSGNRFLSEDRDGRLRGSMDGQILSGKRKVVEGASGQSSTSTHLHEGETSQNCTSMENSLNNSLNITNSHSNLGVSTAQVTNVSSVAPSRAGIFISTSSANAAPNAEGIYRNVRSRASTTLERELFLSNIWPPGSSSRNPNIWAPHQPSAAPYPQLPEIAPPISVSVSNSHSNLPAITSLPQNAHPYIWNGTSHPRLDGSSSSPLIAGERFQPRNIVRSVPVPLTDIGRLGQDPSNWNLSTGGVSPLGSVPPSSRASSSSGSNLTVPPTWPPHHVPRVQLPLRSTEYSRHPFPSIGSETIVRANDLHLQDPTHPISLPEVTPTTGTALRSQQRQLLRSALLMDRHNEGLHGVPLTVRMAALRDGGRGRIISEQIRNALDLIRRGLPYEIVRGDNLRFESLFLGGVDLHDRHRDMRLDVDNMSYEELLALEERIGNVNTGLTEETVMKHLKQWKYTANTIQGSEDIEPCCVCQEQYVEDDDLGTLQCGHDFHSECIKQWLSHKNLCPICKTTAMNIS